MAGAPVFSSIIAAFAAVILVMNLASNQLEGFHWCYGCHRVPGRNDCMYNELLLLSVRRLVLDDQTFSNFSVENAKQLNEYAVLCNSTVTPYCVTESIFDMESYRLFYRDCSDGQHFSLDLNHSRLVENNQLTPGFLNSTHCTYNVELDKTVCILLCTGNFCNGPQDDSSNDCAIAIPASSALHVLCVVALFLLGS